MVESPETIRIWRLKMVATEAADGIDVLSAEERARAVRFRRPGDRKRWEWSRIKLRQVLGSCIRVPASDIVFATAENGKPSLANADICCPHFNLSHAGDVLVVAVSNDYPVGIDVEQVKQLGNLDEVARYSLSQDEYKRFQDAPVQDRTSLFYYYWTQKEAVLKATGQGLGGLGTVDLAEVGALSETTPSPWHQGSDWSVRSIDVPTGYRGAVAVSGESGGVAIRYEL